MNNSKVKTRYHLNGSGNLLVIRQTNLRLRDTPEAISESAAEKCLPEAQRWDNRGNLSCWVSKALFPGHTWEEQDLHYAEGPASSWSKMSWWKATGIPFLPHTDGHWRRRVLWLTSRPEDLQIPQRPHKAWGQGHRVMVSSDSDADMWYRLPVSDGAETRAYRSLVRKLWTEWAFSLPSSQASFVERRSRKQRRDLSPCARPAAVFLLSLVWLLSRERS